MNQVKNSTGTALLIMDIMPVVVPAFGGDDGMLARIASAADAARRTGVDVIYVRIVFRENYADLNPNNQQFAPVAANFDFTESAPSVQVHEKVAPQPGDLHIIKRRVSAFASDLDMLLRSRGVNTIVLTGVSTSGVVLSTVRQASDLDYNIVVLADGCADRDPEVHDFLMSKIFPRQASVTTVADWIDSLKSSA